MGRCIGRSDSLFWDFEQNSTTGEHGKVHPIFGSPCNVLCHVYSVVPCSLLGVTRSYTEAFPSLWDFALVLFKPGLMFVFYSQTGVP